jgi:hypothetical protein
MALSHHQSLLAAYATALLGWLVVARFLPGLWPRRQPHAPERPWLELALALLAALAVVAVGQLYVRRWLLPMAGPFRVALDAVNQVLIFSPVLALLEVRRVPPRDVWLPPDRVWARLLVGCGLALLAALVFTAVRDGSAPLWTVVPRVCHPKNASLLVQVFLEDLTTALLFLRVRAALGGPVAILLVPALFAAGHVPTLWAEGAPPHQLALLLLDAGLGLLAVGVLQRSADIWWFWCVHFAMDMMQFYAVS